MTVLEIIHRRYSSAAGESPAGHFAAVLAGLGLMAISVVLIASVAAIPPGIVIGLVGIMLVGAGIVGHIKGPLTLRGGLDVVVGLTAAAVPLMLVLIATAMVLGLAFTTLFEVIQWLLG